MTFKTNRGIYTELFTRQDLVNILSALEPANVRSGFDHGWIEALCRVGIALSLIHISEPTRPY